MTWQLNNNNPISSVSASSNGTPQNLLTSSPLQTLGRLLCCNCCQYGDSNQSPLGPCDPRPKAMAMVSHSTMVSTFGWSNTECIQSVLQVVAKWVWWHYRSTRVFTSWKFSFDQFKREERKELGNKLLLHSYLYWTFQTVFLYTIWRHTA